MNVEILHVGDRRITRGLAGTLGCEIALAGLVESPVVEQAFAALVEMLRDCGLPENEFFFGAWALRAERDGEVLSIFERDPSWSTWVPGMKLASEWWTAQRQLAAAVASEWSPARATQLVATSPGVFEGRQVEGVRYPAPQHMSGWYLTTDLYDGDVKSLTLHHLHHIGAARPDLIGYLGLAPGFCFDQRSDDKPYFDAEVAAEEP
jgi:hypothetical protein